MTSTRIVAELRKLKELEADNNSHGVKYIVTKSPVDDPSSNIIVGRMFPKSDIFNQAAFEMGMILPPDYPFKPPEVKIHTKMYHPNVSDEGKICITLLTKPGEYKVTTPLVEVVKAVVQLIDNPDLDHALVPEIADEYLNNRAQFNRKALAMVKAHGIPLQ